MAAIGVRELKTKASQIVQSVRKRHARYTITYRGQPIAMIVPLDEPAPTSRAVSASFDDIWDELTRLGAQLAKSWPKNVKSAEVLSKMRR